MVGVLLVTAIGVYANPNSLADEPAPVVVEGISTGDVFGWCRPVVVRGTVQRGVLVLGGDVTVEGRVEGDVATIGGSVRQREGSYIGGDVIVIGGAYHHGKGAPGRNPSSTTIMYAGFELELREMWRDPEVLLVPDWSVAALGQRLVVVLFWFVASLMLTLAIPSQIGSAAARLHLTSLRVAVIGVLGAFVIAFIVPVALHFLPTTLGAVVGIAALLLVLVAYLFGRVVMHAVVGRWLQRKLLPKGNFSESVALLLGAVFFGIVLSVPYVWPLVVAGLVVVSLGLAFTAWLRTD